MDATLGAVAIPAVGGAIVALTQLLGWCVALGLLWVYRRSLSDIFTQFADWLDGFAITIVRTVRPFGPIADAIRDVDGFVIARLEDWVRGSEIALAFFWNHLADEYDRLTGWTAEFGNTVAGSVERIYRQAIPGAIRGLERRIIRRYAAWVAALAFVKTVALPRLGAEVIDLGGRVGWIGRTLRGLREQVSRHSRLLTAAGITGLVMAALGRMRLGWVRCTKVGRLGRATCGMDADLLTALLANTVAMFGTFSLVQFAEEMQDVTEEVAPLVRWFWRVG